MENNKNIPSKVSDSEGFEKAELDLLRDALKRTHQERFHFLTRLVKIQNTMQKAKITHKPAQK